MKHAASALGLLMLLGPPALSQTIEDRTLPFGCHDLVVIGRVKNGEWHRVGAPDDILGHGWADATLTVRRVVRGSAISGTLPVRYFAHTYMRDDRDFMLVLSRGPDGSWVIETGQIMSAHPKLAGQCA